MPERTEVSNGDNTDPARISTGSTGLDNILGGGFDSDRLYLYEGRPGTGKTTLALQFLLEGARKGERTLYISLSESPRELTVVARRHGWSLDGIDIFELVSPETTLDPERELTVLHPAEMELNETTQLVFERVRETEPRHAWCSTASPRCGCWRKARCATADRSWRSSTSSPAATARWCCSTTSPPRKTIFSSTPSRMGSCSWSSWRSTTVPSAAAFASSRCAASSFRGGFHDFTIEKGGLPIFPRLIAAEHHKTFVGDFTPSGNTELDALLGGGLERGTNALLIGGAGVGKSSLALTYAVAAAGRGERAVIFAFDEGRGTLEARARAFGLPLQEAIDADLIRIQQIDPAEMSPGEFAHRSGSVEEERRPHRRHRQPERLPERHARWSAS